MLGFVSDVGLCCVFFSFFFNNPLKIYKKNLRSEAAQTQDAVCDFLTYKHKENQKQVTISFFGEAIIL